MNRLQFLSVVLAASVTLALLTLAMSAIGSAEKKAQKADQEESDRERVFAQLRSQELKTRRAAVESLVNLAPSPEGDQAIRENLEWLARIIEDKREDAEVRGQTVRAIAIVSERKRIDQAIVPILVGILLAEEDDETVRSWIAMTLPDLAAPNVAAPAILAASRSENVAVRVNASQQLGRLRLKSDQLLTSLQRVINDPNMPARMAAVTIAAQLAVRDKRALAVLLQGARDRSPVVRRAAVELLTVEGVLGEDKKKPRELLEKLLEDPHPAVAMHAAAALMELAPEDAGQYVPHLIKGLEAEYAKRREAAAQALATCDAEALAVVPALKRAMTDPVDRVRVHAAMALIRRTSEREPYADVLRELEHSEDAEVEMWAKSYLGLLLAGAETQSVKDE